MYAKGMSVNSIAQTLGCCFKEAVKVLRDNGIIPKRHPKSHDFDIDSFKHRYLVLNHTLAEIARDYRCNVSCARDFADRNKFLKVKTQKSKEYKKIKIPKETLEHLVTVEKKSDIKIANQFGVCVQKRLVSTLVGLEMMSRNRLFSRLLRFGAANGLPNWTCLNT